jgi:uncharacterized protein involved in exopolysaccharide biosynthesis
MVQRLLSVRQELEGRPVLEKVIKQLNLYPDIVSKSGMDDALDQMRVDLDVKAAGEMAFELTYSARNAEVAAKVANLIPKVYAEETTRLREQQALQATAVFTQEIGALKAQVADGERKVAQFKVDHNGELPEQLETNLRELDRINNALNTKSEELRVAETHRSELFRSHAPADTEAGRLKATEDQLVQQLEEGKSRWTGDHPEVTRLKEELGAIKERRIAAENAMAAERQERVRAAKWVESLHQDMAELATHATAIQKRLANTPATAEELSGLNRDLEILKTKYQSVVGRKVESEIAQELEAKNAPNMFNIISPAGISSTPAKPDRMTGLLVALLAAVAAGVLTGVMMEMRDDSIRDLSELHGRLQLPVLAVVPDLSLKSAERRVLMPLGAGRQSPPTSLN